MRKHPGAYLHDWGYEFVHFFAPMPDRIQTVNSYTGRGPRLLVALWFTPILLLASFGLQLRWVAASDRRLLVLVPLATALLYAFFFSQMRYRIPTEPQLVVLAACAVEAGRRRWFDREAPKAQA